MSFIINKKSGEVWAYDKVGDEYLLHKYNYSMFISKDNVFFILFETNTSKAEPIASAMISFCKLDNLYPVNVIMLQP